MSRVPYTQATALTALEQAGRQLAARAQPSYHAFEDRHRAAAEARKLPAMRDAYAAVRRGGPDALRRLRSACRAVGGIEGNLIRLVALDLYGVDLYAGHP